jgi:hypothetical protein
VQLSGVPHAGQLSLAFPGIADQSVPTGATASTATLCVGVAVGDYNDSGRTNFIDFFAVQQAGVMFGPVNAATARADFNGDGQINLLDFNAIKNAHLIDGPNVKCP